MDIPKLHGRYITSLDQIIRVWMKHHGEISPKWQSMFELRIIELGLVWLPIKEIDDVFRVSPKLNEFEALWRELKIEEQENLRVVQEERKMRIKAREMQEADRKNNYQRNMAICKSCDSGITTDGFCGCNRL